MIKSQGSTQEKTIILYKNVDVNVKCEFYLFGVDEYKEPT